MEVIHLIDREVNLKTGQVTGAGLDELMSARQLPLLQHLVLNRDEVVSRGKTNIESAR